MYDAIIVGGGIAGCATAIRLSSLGHNVLVLERGYFPTHKICGEFLSTEVGSALQSLGVLDRVLFCGAAPISDVLITTVSGKMWKREMPGTAYGLSRYCFDRILFDKAIETGSECRTRTPVLEITGGIDTGFVVRTAEAEFRSRLVFGAYGKKPALGAKLTGKRKPVGSAYVGFKQHYAGSGPDNVIEVHTFDRGYCGINRIEDGKINVCWLADKSLLKRCGGKREVVMDQFMSRNSYLRKRLSGLHPIDGTLCAIGDASLQHKGQVVDDVLMVGDSAQMIAPFCGDGMAMALQSSAIAADLSADFLANKISRTELIQNYKKSWNTQFTGRLAIGKLLQSVALCPPAADLALTVLNLAPRTGAWLISQTRGTPNPSKQPSIVNPGPNASATPNP